MTPSVRADNRFRFHCPVVNRDETYLACVFRRHRKWRGERVDCGGCSAAMSANKCPAIHMIMMECPPNEPSKAIFFDPKGEKLFGIPKAVAERIEKVVILPFHCRGLNVSPEMHELLTGTREQAGTVLIPAPVTAKSLPAAPRQERRKTAKSTEVSVDTGEDSLNDMLSYAEVDMAGALNRGQ